MDEILQSPHTIIIIYAFLLDIILGDPRWFYHPVQWIGYWARLLERLLRRTFARYLKAAGVLVVLVIVGGTCIATYGLSIALYTYNPWLGMLFEAFGIYTSLALGSLTREGWSIRSLLLKKNSEGARTRTSYIVSRDLSKESENGIIRATIESLSENLSDGVIAPLLYACIGGAPLALTYKAINTLDSMFGYKNEVYKDFGWASARLDDLANIIPARLTGILLVVSAVLLKGHPVKAIRAWVRDAQKGPSPNGGIPIVTFAGATDIQLGGNCWAPDGTEISIPTVGGSRSQLTPTDIWWTILYIYLSSSILLVACVVL